MQIRSVEFAKKYHVPLEVRSTFTNTRGTRVTEEYPDMEKVVVRGVAHDKNQAKISILGVPDQPGIAAKVFQAAAQAHLNVDMIIQNASHGGRTDLTYTVPQTDVTTAMEVANTLVTEVGAKGVEGDEKVGKVSIVGVGMRSHPGVAAKMFSILAQESVNIQMISTSEIKISCVVEESQCEQAVRALHDAFELGDRETVSAVD